MVILLARIDDRFIHGQVTVGWSQKLRPGRIILCNDEIAADPWQSRVYRSSVPPHIKVSILSGAEAVAALAGAGARLGGAPPVGAPPVGATPVGAPEGISTAGEKAILLVGSPADMHFLLTQGLALTEVNVGGMHYTEGKVALLPYVYVDRTDVDVFRSFLERGVRLVARQVPGAREVALDRALLDAVEARL